MTLVRNVFSDGCNHFFNNQSDFWKLGKWQIISLKIFFLFFLVFRVTFWILISEKVSDTKGSLWESMVIMWPLLWLTVPQSLGLSVACWNLILNVCMIDKWCWFSGIFRLTFQFLKIQLPISGSWFKIWQHKNNLSLVNTMVKKCWTVQKNKNKCYFNFELSVKQHIYKRSISTKDAFLKSIRNTLPSKFIHSLRN